MLKTSRLLRVLRARPRLWSSLAFGLFVGLVLPDSIIHQGQTRFLLGWNACALLYLALTVQMFAQFDPVRMQRRALHQNEGRVFVLIMVVVSSVSVLMAIGSQLSLVKDMHGLTKTVHVSLAAVTVLSSWLFTQTLFALHYAHDFYAARAHGREDVFTFPGTHTPDFGDFFYFAAVIGTSGQTADVSFSASDVRRVGVLHCILSFFFNTTVLSLTINIAAGLF